MTWLKLTEQHVKDELGLGRRTLENYRARGCPGVALRGKRLFFNPKMVRDWAERIEASRPGPKATGTSPSSAPTSAPDTPRGDLIPLMDPERVKELEEFYAGLGDGFLEVEIAVCKRLFERLSGMVLTWPSARLEEAEDQGSFSGIAKTLAVVASRLERMEGRLIDLRRRHGDLLPHADVDDLINRIIAELCAGTSTLPDALVAAAQALFGDAVEPESLRERVAASVDSWREKFATSNRREPQGAAA